MLRWLLRPMHLLFILALLIDKIQTPVQFNYILSRSLEWKDLENQLLSNFYSWELAASELNSIAIRWASLFIIDKLFWRQWYRSVRLKFQLSKVTINCVREAKVINSWLVWCRVKTSSSISPTLSLTTWGSGAPDNMERLAQPICIYYCGIILVCEDQCMRILWVNEFMSS